MACSIRKMMGRHAEWSS